jgi:lipopolysaccharide biosynthesis protein
MKIIALYLPQYHEIPENDQWWGKGYTEWDAVKNATKYFRFQNQPKTPLNGYYDLSDPNAKALKEQCDLAKKYGVFGFCFYHYWFGDKMLLEKPSEILLNQKGISTNFFFCWANETWRKAWYGLDNDLLIEQKYLGKEDRKKHFLYLLPFFKDPRYIKIHNKPVFCIYKTTEMPDIIDLMFEWNGYAKKYGFDGVYFVSANTSTGIDKRPIYDAWYNFEPGFTTKNGLNFLENIDYYGSIVLRMMKNKVFHSPKPSRLVSLSLINRASLRLYKKCKKSRITYAGICPCWDNTPRRQGMGMVYFHDSPRNFYLTLKKLNQIVGKDDFVFVNAWNEWGEGCHLEPDVNMGYQYLEAIKKVVFPYEP